MLPAPDAEGLLTGRDGRMFAVPDPAALVARLNAQPAEARIDFDHETEPMSRTYLGSTRAQGWARDWRVEAGGAISALLDLHAPALGAVQRREYRYLSPAVAHNRRGVISGISSVGLVNNPNLHVPALSAEEDPMEPSDPQPGAEARTQALDAREQALAQREEQIATQAVGDAVAASRITPAERDYHLNAIRRHPDGVLAGAEAFRSLLSARPAPAAGVSPARAGMDPPATVQPCAE